MDLDYPLCGLRYPPFVVMKGVLSIGRGAFQYTKAGSLLISAGDRCSLVALCGNRIENSRINKVTGVVLETVELMEVWQESRVIFGRYKANGSSNIQPAGMRLMVVSAQPTDFT